jgi:hypothetical protein
MRLKIILIAVAMLPFTIHAQSLDDLKKMKSSDVMESAGKAMNGSLASVLQGQLGIDQEQAEGGIGSMLTLANEKLGVGDYDKLAGIIPGADKYLQSAKDLGAVTGPLNNIEGLNSALSSLGISPESASKFVPMVTEYLGKLGGDDIMSMLQKVFGS